MKDIREKAYEKYQLDWMIQHGYSISDLFQIMDNLQKEGSEDVFHDFLERGFGGEIFACMEEFLDAEYLDTEFMRYLLNAKEYYEYLDDIIKEA